MNIDDALQLLTSDHPHDRLRGARAIFVRADSSHIPTIQRTLAKESVPWVKRALTQVLTKLTVQGPLQNKTKTDEALVDDVTIRDIYLRASEEMVSTLLHEIRPKIGFIRNAATQEITNFEGSDTKKRIEYLDELLDLLAEFRKVSQSPKIEAFDLADMVTGVIGELKVASSVRVAGLRPMIVLGDAKRIRLAVTNGLRNAVEANSAVQDTIERIVIINWAVDNDFYWISIVDQGLGIHGSVEGMFEIGRTTKHDHFGMGLPIAKQAIMSLGGDVKLVPGANGGARFEIFWEKLSNLTGNSAT